VDEAPLVESEGGGLVPAGEGWFVLNAHRTRWLESTLGEYCNFEGPEVRFPQVGINLNRLEPGEAMAMYHREDPQEDFLVLAGECLLIVEGEERALRPWDFFHCPSGTAHTIVGAGDGPALVLAVGARTGEASRVVYPADPAARRRGAGVETETSKPADAYAGHSYAWRAYGDGWLPH
jgi:uncharacterized cupin superfamily protein